MSKKPDTKFCISEKIIANNFEKISQFGNVYYPLKTNSNKQILQIIKPLVSQSGGFLLSSLKHFYTLKKLDIDTQKMAFINVCADEKTVKKLYQKNVRFFVFDNMQELEKFTKYADKQTTKICIRISVCDAFDCDFSHLGANLQLAQKMLEFLKNNGFLYGISFYLHKKLKFLDNSIQIMLDYIAKNFAGFDIKFLNIGGIFENTNGLLEQINKIKTKLDLDEINLEPGTRLLENAVCLYSKILRKKHLENCVCLIIKNGIYSGFFDSVLYGKKFDLALACESVFDLEKTKTKNSVPVKIFGSSCDSDDYVGEYYLNKTNVEKIKNCDYVLVKNCGAYFEELFVDYCQDNQKQYVIIK